MNILPDITLKIIKNISFDWNLPIYDKFFFSSLIHLHFIIQLTFNDFLEMKKKDP